MNDELMNDELMPDALQTLTPQTYVPTVIRPRRSPGLPAPHRPLRPGQQPKSSGCGQRHGPPGSWPLDATC
jgi:hypothetical protein